MDRPLYSQVRHIKTLLLVYVTSTVHRKPSFFLSYQPHSFPFALLSYTPHSPIRLTVGLFLPLNAVLVAGGGMCPTVSAPSAVLMT